MFVLFGKLLEILLIFLSGCSRNTKMIRHRRNGLAWHSFLNDPNNSLFRVEEYFDLVRGKTPETACICRFQEKSYARTVLRSAGKHLLCE